MEDETMITNGVGTENYDPAAEVFDEVDQPESDMKLKQKFEALEKEKCSEKCSLANENEEIKTQIQQLTAEIESLRSDESKLKLRLEILESEKQESEESKRALDAIATRALQLETEVSRLQHDLISSMSAAEEANAEVFGLKNDLRDKEETFEEIKKEKLEVEKKLLDLEIKLEEMRNKNIDEYEKKLQESKEKMKEMEHKMVETRKKLDESEKDIGDLKERSTEDTNGFRSESLEKEKKGYTAELPTLAMGFTIGFTGALLATSLYVRYARRS